MKTSETDSFVPFNSTEIQDHPSFWKKESAEITSLIWKQVQDATGSLENMYLWKVVTHEGREFGGDVKIPLGTSISMGKEHLANSIKSSVLIALKVPV